MSILEIWVKNFSQWEPLGQGLFILFFLGSILSFITVLVRGYPNGKE